MQEIMKKMQRGQDYKTHILTFLKAQLSAFTGGIVDYFAMIFFTEVVGFFYPYSIVIGGLIGAVVNFSLNRYWTFGARDEKKRKQVPKFVVMVLGSIALKTLGTYCLTHYTKLDYRISRPIIDLFVSLGFNYTLQKYWVFTNNSKQATGQDTCGTE
jgi:putative flippase GtrA